MAKKKTTTAQRRRRAAQDKALDKAHATLKTAELAALHVDLDQALTEYERAETPGAFTFKGEQYSVPSSAPANFTMFYLRHCVTEVDGKLGFTVKDEHMAEFLTLMLGEQLAAAILDTPTPMGFVVAHVMPAVFAMWGMDLTKPIEQLQQGGASATPE